MTTKSLVSVIVPAYNTEKYIDKCLDSLLHQSYREMEVIMIDDGSKDETGNICKKICASRQSLPADSKEKYRRIG